MPRTVGIDLGTTNSVVAVMEGSEPTIIPLAEGGRLCPSVVGFTKAGERLVGQLAKRQAISNPDRTIASIKRQMGKEYKVSIDGTQYTPQEISAMVLQKLKADAEAYLGEKVAQAVVTVPAYFSDAQRQATKDAGTIAGLEVLRIINEPTAAALAYGLDREGMQTLLVWDLGGGTFDVSILELDEGVFEVKATNGDTYLGGDDWDNRVVEWLTDEFRKEHQVDLRRDRMAMQRLREAAEKAKVELSSVVTTNVNLPFLSSTPDGPAHLDANLTRAAFESMTGDLLERMVAPTRQAMADARLEPAQIERVLLVGGSTRMPAVQELARRVFGKDPYRGVNPDEVVAAGAAIQAGVLSGEVRDMLLLDVTPLSLGIETLGGVMSRIIERNTTIPTSATQMFTTASDRQRTVEIKVFQGEREIAAYNKALATFQLTGIPPAPRGAPKVAVTFDIDVNGIVHVSAKDTATGNEQRVAITSSTGLSADEIDRMIQDAQSHADEDRARREGLEARNRAESVLEGAERALRDRGHRAAPATVESVRSAADALRAALAADGGSSAREASEALAAALYRLEAEAAASPAEGAGEAPPSPEDAVRSAVDDMNARADQTAGAGDPG
ncbi:MAG: molecular chaperone DnaK [Chthonomonadales bacterium]|nr:molecular chaperone DnaK [Chthonomonadales bacterium]